ncbi:GNAT family N-acetyltransferase [Zobellia russellii]|uniref:GNAT family N-acetyltransferase n=1 Tax=Zobellia russellii TaxID=248907 RepID=UPI0037DD235E
MEDKLKNPVWYSLNETHSQFSHVGEGIAFYKPDYCPFGGANAIEKATQSIVEYSQHIKQFFVVGSQPLPSPLYTLQKEYICDQMILRAPIDLKLKNQITSLTSNLQKNELYELVSLVQPGYFTKKTAELGRYFGIYKNNVLVAAAGERLQMNDFTEISAVVTHPEHTGNGYAKELLKYTSDIIFKSGKTPFLHVLEINTRAIGIYKSLGFQTLRKMSFNNLMATDSNQHNSD